jgi:3-oxoacyl-[acyl-carrier-protein] synthase II
VRRRVVVTGAGAVSSLAGSAAELHLALCAGGSGLKPIELFPTDGLGRHLGGEIRPFDPAARLGDRNLRPVDRTARLLLVAVHQALEAAGWDEGVRRDREVGIALGTTFCSVRTIAEFDRRGLQLGPARASPLDFANCVLNAATGQAAIWFGLRGVNSTLSGGEASALQAIGYAADLVATGRSEAMLTGGAEELCFESFLGHFRARRLCGSDGGGTPCPVPFDARRDGFALAEGAAMVTLEPAEAAAARGAPVLAEVLGHGTAFDPSGDEEGLAAALAAAVGEALASAGLVPGDLDCASVSASGSVAGDRAEARGLAAALDGRAATLPVSALMSLLGVARGARGGLLGVALLGTLAVGRRPGLGGLGPPEPGFPLAGVSADTRRIAARRGLLPAVGADRHSAAGVLGAAAEGR